MKRILVTFAITVAALCGAAAIYLALGALSQADSNSRATGDLREDISTLAAANKLLEEQIKDLGETPVVTTPGLLPPETRYVPVPGPPGPPGASIRGADGVNGAPGASIPGADGADGADGAPGKDGRDGRGIASVSCGADNTWTVTFTDGESMNAGGPCRAELVPAP